jgi:hypothetical protein
MLKYTYTHLYIETVLCLCHLPQNKVENICKTLCNYNPQKRSYKKWEKYLHHHHVGCGLFLFSFFSLNEESREGKIWLFALAVITFLPPFKYIKLQFFPHFILFFSLSLSLSLSHARLSLALQIMNILWHLHLLLREAVRSHIGPLAFRFLLCRVVKKHREREIHFILQRPQYFIMGEVHDPVNKTLR